VSRSASDDEIAKAYKKEARKWHPDKYKDSDKAKAQDMFQKISTAYEVLKDAEKRRIYDQFGEEGLKQGGHKSGGFGDPFDFFSSFGFGGGGNRAAQREQEKGPNLVIDLDVTLRDLYVGRDLIVTQKKQTLCPQCRGTGAKNPDDVQTCPVCKGTGVRVQVQKLGPGFVTQTQTTCEKCQGKGKIIKGHCPFCQGKKISTGEETLTVVIERGMPNGEEIVFEQEGDQAPEVTPGNLIFKINTMPHPKFTRQGDNLHYKGEITLLEALIGFKKFIKHLDGHTVTLQRNSVTKPGHVMIIKGEGMPIHKYPSQKGDLYVTFSVKFPDKITEEQRQGFIKLLSD